MLLSLIIFILTVGILTIIAIIILPDWMSHLTMTRRFSDRYGYSNYKKFKENFTKYEWENSTTYEKSLWNKEKDCELHANIIKFEGNGMIMRNPFDLWLVNSFKKKYVKNKYGEGKKNKIYW